MKQKITIVIGISISMIICIYLFIQNNKETEEWVEETPQNEQEIIKKEEPQEIVVHIAGEVKNPGIVKVKEGSRIIDAIEVAGGVTEMADSNRINLAQIIGDGERIVIPSKKSEIEEEESVEIQEKTKKVNINTAGLEELKTLNGIGDSLGNRILEYRKENGKFKKIEDLKDVSGIGESKYNKIKENICI